MRWYLLRDRRHEGPYSKEQLAEGIRAGKIDPRDYLLPEQAIKDQSSFACISAADVVGPEFIFDLNKKNKPQASPLDTQSPNEVKATVSKESLISEFEEGLESTQLIQLRKERSQSEATQKIVGDSFTSAPAETFKFPWAIAGTLVVILAVAGILAGPLMSKIAPKPAEIVKSETKEVPATAFRSVQKNRIPTGRVQLPAATSRAEEPSAAFDGPREEEAAEPKVKKRRKRKAVDKESTEAAVDENEAASDVEFDEEEYVEEDESEEDVVDEADI